MSVYWLGMFFSCPTILGVAHLPHMLDNSNWSMAMAVVNWGATVPKKVNELFIHIEMFNHIVAPGTSLVRKSWNRAEIGHIVGDTCNKSLSINLFLWEGNNRLSGTYTNRSRLIDDTIHHIGEVIQTPMVVMVNPDNMKDLAFVFRPDDVKGQGLQGMTNLFICRKCSDNTRVDKLYSLTLFVPLWSCALFTVMLLNKRCFWLH
jgi:hypothetical protein